MKAFYAGSFDPFTIGHKWIAEKALEFFGEIIVGIGVNENKKHREQTEERLRSIQKVFESYGGVTVIAYEGLTAQAAKDHGAGVLVRGVRNSLDFVKEKELADINLKVFGIPTVFIPSGPGMEYVSSSMIRELEHFGYDAQEFIAKGNK